MNPADRIALVTILECVAKVRTYVRQTGDTWTTDDMTVDAIAKRLEEIGELSKRLGPDTLERMPAVDWRGVKGMREILVHDYGHVQIVIIESVVANDLGGLDDGVRSLLKETGE